MAEPQYIRQMMIRSGELAGWLTTSRKLAEAEGCTHFRASRHPQLAGLALFEGWKEKPADMGKPRWALRHDRHDRTRLSRRSGLENRQ